MPYNRSSGNLLFYEHTGADGKMYDVDFFMNVQGSKLNITETSVHKINGKPLYNRKQDGGV